MIMMVILPFLERLKPIYTRFLAKIKIPLPCLFSLLLCLIWTDSGLPVGWDSNSPSSFSFFVYYFQNVGWSYGFGDEFSSFGYWISIDGVGNFGLSNWLFVYVWLWNNPPFYSYLWFLHIMIVFVLASSYF